MACIVKDWSVGFVDEDNQPKKFVEEGMRDLLKSLSLGFSPHPRNEEYVFCKAVGISKEELNAEPFGFRAQGTIYSSPNPKFPDGGPITTSKIVEWECKGTVSWLLTTESGSKYELPVDEMSDFMRTQIEELKRIESSEWENAFKALEK